MCFSGAVFVGGFKLTSSFFFILALFSCGTKPNTDSSLKIKGGIDIGADEYNSIVRIKLGRGSCSASFIRPDVVMTAAHCVPNSGYRSGMNIISSGLKGNYPVRKMAAPRGAIDKMARHVRTKKINASDASYDITLFYLKYPVSRNTLGLSERYANRYDPVMMVGFILR